MEKFSLPHSFSSPEFPVPSIKTSTLRSTPLVTLHTSPLISPNSRSCNVTDIMLPIPTIRSSFFNIDLEQSYDFDSPTQSKKYGRSHSETILPGIERSGELIDSSKPPPSNPWLKRSLFSLSLHERTPKTVTSTGRIKLDKRSRSLSPYVPKCLCYNCNVSELILKSRDLPPVERFNFDIYFARSLSHKFFNCSCYSSLQDVPSRFPRSVSFNDSYGCHRGITGLDHPDLPFIYLKNRLLVFPERQSVAPYLESKVDHCVIHKHQSRGHDRSEWMLFKEKEKWRFDKNIMSRKLNSDSVIGNTRIPFRKLSCPNVRPGDFSCVDSVCSDENGEVTDCSKMYRCWSCPNVNFQWHDSLVHIPNHSSMLYHMSPVHDNDVHDDHEIPRKYYYRSKSPREPFSRLQPQRSFSSPDTRPSIIQPDPTCTARRHRHSISGQMSYFKLLGYNVNKKLTGSANSLFSTAVISGSSSAPNLKDMVPPHASAVAGESQFLFFFFIIAFCHKMYLRFLLLLAFTVSIYNSIFIHGTTSILYSLAIEGFGGVPPIRPLETLHNALSLRQLDSFLEMMTSAPLFRTPASSPPKYPSPGGSTHESVNQNINIGGVSREYHSSDLEAVRYRKKLSKPSL